MQSQLMQSQAGTHYGAKGKTDEQGPNCNGCNPFTPLLVSLILDNVGSTFGYDSCEHKTSRKYFDKRVATKAHHREGFCFEPKFNGNSTFSDVPHDREDRKNHRNVGPVLSNLDLFGFGSFPRLFRKRFHCNRAKVLIGFQLFLGAERSRKGGFYLFFVQLDANEDDFACKGAPFPIRAPLMVVAGFQRPCSIKMLG